MIRFVDNTKITKLEFDDIKSIRSFLPFIRSLLSSMKKRDSIVIMVVRDDDENNEFVTEGWFFGEKEMMLSAAHRVYSVFKKVVSAESENDGGKK